MMENKITYTSHDTTIRKSNEISKAKLFHGLSLNQMQLFAYAIYETQKNSSSSFRKVDFEKQFNLGQYHTKQAYRDCKTLMSTYVELPTEDRDSFKLRSIFLEIAYKKGKFTFEFTDYIKPHILELKERFIQTDLKVAVNFKSSFSWTLYDYLKASYGFYYLEFTKEELMQLFNVQNVKSYNDNTGLFKKNVLDIAIKEINEFTEYRCKYDEIKKGRAIIGFNLHFHKGTVEKLATAVQVNYLKELYKTAQFEFMFEINKIVSEEQRKFGSYLFEQIINDFVQIEQSDKLIQSYVDEKIKQTNERIQLLRKIIKEDKENASIDPFAEFDIPIDYWKKRRGGKD